MSASNITASSAMPPGTRLGEFEITGVIGEGGFGIVYSARDSSLDRIVAVKEYLPAAFASRTTAGTVQVRSQEHSKTFDAGLASFINEARMLAKFSHPGLVEVFRFWEANGTAYMAMRYYRGVTLREMLRTNPQVVTEQWLCETLDPILLALQELHNEKCYHRDIAPDNILVLPNGRSVLMDFGAARRIIGGMTRALTTVLKPGYAPIEQYSDDGSMAQGAWTDIYAVGGLLYHAMTGKVPVQAISRMMNDPLKPVAVAARGEFSENLCNVVMKCLAVMPENRYQSVDELRAALGWVTTPVSSTVMLSQTGFVRPPVAAPTSAGPAGLTAAAAGPIPVAPVAQPAAMAPPAARPATPVAADPLARLGAASAADPLADLIGGTKPSQSPATAKPPVAAATNKAKSPAPAPAAPAASANADGGKRSAMPIAVVGVVALAVIGWAAYLMMGRDSAPTPVAKPPVVTPPVAEVRPEPPKEVPPPPPASPPPANDRPETPPPTASAPSPSPAVEPTKATDPTPTAAATPTAAGSDPAAAVGKVDLRVSPWGNITVDGVAKGTSPPLKQLSLPAGTHTIVIQNPSSAPVSKTVDVVAGKSATVRHSF